jgi:hypothetical protein
VQGWTRQGRSVEKGTTKYKLRRGSTDSGDGVGEQESEERVRERELGEEERKGVAIQFIENGREGKRALGCFKAINGVNEERE